MPSRFVRERGLPALDAHPLEAACVLRSAVRPLDGVRDEDVDAAPAVADRGDRLGARVDLPQLQREHERLAAGRLDLPGGGAGSGLTGAVGEGHLRSLGPVGLGDGSPDPGRASGDQYDPPAHSRVHP